MGGGHIPLTEEDLLDLRQFTWEALLWAAWKARYVPDERAVREWRRRLAVGEAESRTSTRRPAPVPLTAPAREEWRHEERLKALREAEEDRTAARSRNWQRSSWRMGRSPGSYDR